MFKKRLDKNRHRSIVLARGGRVWVYEYLFAKKDRDNIDERQLSDLRKLATAYGKLIDDQLVRFIADKDFVEICHADQA